MRKVLITVLATIAIAAFAAVPTSSEAKGCLKGAAVGGVAGHVAGGHGLIGAGAGCAIEHHREKSADKKAAQAAKNAPAPQPAAEPAPAAQK